MINTSSLAELFQRIPKVALFSIAALVQLAALALMVIDRVYILRAGTEVTLQIRPVDPRDLLRGDYVILSYEISQLPAGPLAGTPVREHNPFIFVKLRPNQDGIYETLSVHTDAVTVESPEVLIRGRVENTCYPDQEVGFNVERISRSYSYVFCSNLQINYNIERYFVPEGEGRKLEQIRDKRKLMVVAAVLPSGRAAIKRLLVDGQPVYDEPWF